MNSFGKLCDATVLQQLEAPGVADCQEVSWLSWRCIRIEYNELDKLTTNVQVIN